MQQIIPPTLRDRKRAETRAQLEQAAIDLVLRDGLDGATIDAISDRAFVSPRTFFNYFDSKEDALLGIPDVEMVEEALSTMIEHVPDDDLLGNITHMLVQTLAPFADNRKLHKRRTEILRRYPQLLHRHMAQLARMSEQLSAFALQLMERDPAYTAGDAAPSVAEAEVLLMMCGGALRTAGHEWVEGKRTGSNSIDDIHQIETRASALVREVIQKLR
ncbi:MAG TPA: TetR/AcrR family transcriptional regulator [Microbacteriaceae bacterium]